MNRNRSPSGYVLLMVLLLLALAGFSMAGLARLSLRRSAAAQEAQEELQRRWGFESLTANVLPRSLDLLDATPPLTRRSIAITLGGQRFEALLGDEEAKVNVNALSYWYGPARGRVALDAMLARLGGGLKIALHPPVTVRKTAAPTKAKDGDDGDNDQNDADDGGDRMTPSIASFGQLFTTNDPRALRPTLAGSSPLDAMTCWGSGRLNVHTASRAALIEATRGSLTEKQIDQLLAIRAAQPEATVEQLLEGVGEQNVRLHPLRRRLSEESFCSSLWISTESHGRRYDRLAVRDDGPARATRWTFDWTP